MGTATYVCGACSEQFFLPAGREFRYRARFCPRCLKRSREGARLGTEKHGFRVVADSSPSYPLCECAKCRYRTTMHHTEFSFGPPPCPFCLAGQRPKRRYREPRPRRTLRVGVGQRFGAWVTLSDGAWPLCCCDCGTQRAIKRSHLRADSAPCGYCSLVRVGIEPPVLGEMFATLRVVVADPWYPTVRCIVCGWSTAKAHVCGLRAGSKVCRNRCTAPQAGYSAT